MNLKEDGPIYAIKVCLRIFISSYISDKGIERKICQQSAELGEESNLNSPGKFSETN